MPERSRQWAGELDLAIAARNGRSHARHQFHQGALRILRPLYLDDSGQVCYPVVNPGGGYLGADHYRVDVTVEAGASLLLTTQSATKVYRTPQGEATQQMQVQLGEDAVLESLPDQVIIYADGRYRQQTRVTMAPTASLVMAEVVTPGWSADGTPFRYDGLRMRTEVSIGTAEEHRLFVVDQLRLVPGEAHGLTGIGQMEGWSHVGQLLVVDRRIDDDLLDRVAALADQAPTCSGTSLVGVPADDGVRGLVVRSLASRTEHLVALHEGVANLLRRIWRAQGPVALRKY